MSPIGARPPGSIPRQSHLVKLAEEALTYVGCQNITYIMGSTDANIPLSHGYQAVCVGLTESGNAHRLNEFIDTKYLIKGVWQVLLIVLAAASIK
jgi:di/tripeptidase